MDLCALSSIGAGLNRPESVLATSNGDVWAAHWAGGGVSRIRPDGSVRHHLPKNPVADIHPNGIALMPDGSFLLANLGDAGGIWQLTQKGALKPFLTDIEGKALPPCNFVSVDAKGRIWISVSTRRAPRALAYRGDVADGFIIMMDENGPQIVADALGYTNEILVSPCGQWLYANETFGRRLTRFPVLPTGGLGACETVAAFGRGLFPDGLAFDEQGGIWIISIISNCIVRIAPDGHAATILKDYDPYFLDEVETAFAAGTMGRAHLDANKSAKLRNISSIGFAGKDRRTAILGCLLGDHLQTFRTPFTGVEPVHWHWNVQINE
ncbi:MAG: SMP-30/gluconolactonase/LRE family protein [Sphingomonadales bacterium]|nr:SMP-30/gluconolactonase/LRE family protein [Sphingomonadales bacterium]